MSLRCSITDVVAEARLTYAFCPGSYSMSAFNAALAIERAHAREAAPDWIALYFDYHDTVAINRGEDAHDRAVEPVT